MGYSYIEHNVETVRASIGEAAARANRNPDDVRIVAVTKSVSPDVLPALRENHIIDVAENRWQVARDKLAHPLSEEFRWHFIGSLQLNKVKYIARRFSFVHSIDRDELYEALSNEVTRIERPSDLEVLLQVNVAEESQKHGYRIENVAASAKKLCTLPGISLRGLMTMAPLQGDETTTRDVREVFQSLREVHTELRELLSLETFDQLSMGMSDDYSIAVEEGATMVRIGRHLVGESNPVEGRD